ncbi:tryptophan-rich sensory protein [Ancylobacter sp. MQZ15Z-1]|uniref:Tryptophan-rich sensory protein n=1 Tax=Ancylobacter mangrovi TaxID=2972472 RepID=A0A9X2PE35_9HYPH|nr:TspO/MBR family protein [Ancylobacter mangrovi]MCS0495196.1 tryptophan-rich sensory protein [Ancylobacter mangrovi]
MKTLSFFRLVLAVGLCLAVGAVGSLVTTPQIPTWYAALAKPAWTPPDALFPLVWTVLYVLMAVTLWRLWQLHNPSPERRRAVGLWFLQLALNALWTPVFFGFEAIGWGMAVIGALWLAILATILACARIDSTAGWLMVPYLLWVSYATALNAAILAMN